MTNAVLQVNLTYILDGFTTWCFDHCFVDFQKILLENDLLLSDFGEIKMYKNILLPLDGSKLAEESLSTAVNLAKIFGSKISLIHSAETFSLLKDNVYDNVIEDNKVCIKAGAEKGKLDYSDVCKNCIFQTWLDEGRDDIEFRSFQNGCSTIVFNDNDGKLYGFSAWAPDRIRPIYLKLRRWLKKEITEESK